MAVKLISVTCPECGAVLNIEDNREQAFCTYCGTKVLIHNENEYIYRHIDEAGIKQAETDRMIRLKELEIEQTQQHHEDHLRKRLTNIWIGSIFAVAVLCIVVWITGGELGGLAAFNCLFYVGGPVVGGGAYLLFKVLPEKDNEKILMKNGGVRIPKSLEPFSEQDVEVVEQALRSAGFRNITTSNMHDITIGLLQKPGKVETISVNGKEITSGGKVYLPDVPIAIKYHGR